MTSSDIQAYSSIAGVRQSGKTPSHNRVTISDIEGQWQTSAQQRLEELLRLEEGWDGYNGFPVSFANAMYAFRVLEAICRPDTPAPQIVPGSSGDLQLEWHEQGGDVELWVRGPNDVHAWRSLSDNEDGEEIDLTTDFSIVSEWLKEAMERTIAGTATA